VFGKCDERLGTSPLFIPALVDRSFQSHPGCTDRVPLYILFLAFHFSIFVEGRGLETYCRHQGLPFISQCWIVRIPYNTEHLSDLLQRYTIHRISPSSPD
jgi:hypothetical protein